MTLIPTTAQLRDKAERCRGLARGQAVTSKTNRHVERVFNPDRKDKHWGKRKIKRDE